MHFTRSVFQNVLIWDKRENLWSTLQVGGTTHAFIIRNTIMSLHYMDKYIALCISVMGCTFKKSIYGVKTNMQIEKQNISLE